jgi:hypothetical protein
MSLNVGKVFERDKSLPLLTKPTGNEDVLCSEGIQ